MEFFIKLGWQDSSFLWILLVVLTPWLFNILAALLSLCLPKWLNESEPARSPNSERSTPRCRAEPYDLYTMDTFGVRRKRYNGDPYDNLSPTTDMLSQRHLHGAPGSGGTYVG